MSDNLESRAQEYRNLRDQRSALKATYEAQDEKLKEAMAAIEAEFIAMCKDLGCTSMRTPAGTIIYTETKRYWPSDWDKMYKFIHHHHAYELLERRVSQSAMRDWLEQNPGVAPPGLSFSIEEKATVRAK